MATTTDGVRFPVATDSFQPHVDMENLARDVDATKPWGVLDLSEKTTPQTGIALQVDVTGLTGAFTAVAGRLYKVTAKVPVTIGSTAANYKLFLSEGSDVLDEMDASSSIGAAGTEQILSGTSFVTPTAGAHAYKLSIFFSTGTNNQISAGAARKGFLVVEDIGPTPA